MAFEIGCTALCRVKWMNKSLFCPRTFQINLKDLNRVRLLETLLQPGRGIRMKRWQFNVTRQGCIHGRLQKKKQIKRLSSLNQERRFYQGLKFRNMTSRGQSYPDENLICQGLHIDLTQRFVRILGQCNQGSRQILNVLGGH